MNKYYNDCKKLNKFFHPCRNCEKKLRADDKIIIIHFELGKPSTIYKDENYVYPIFCSEKCMEEALRNDLEFKGKTLKSWQFCEWGELWYR